MKIKYILKIKFSLIILILIVIFFSTGCFYTTLSFNNGKILSPGVSSMGLGLSNGSYIKEDDHKISQEKIDSILLQSPNYYSEWEIPYSVLYYDTLIEQKLFSPALLYRLGVLAEYPFGGGLDIGWLLQGPIPLQRGELSVTIECNTRAGFNSFRFANGIIKHNMELGWLIGQYIDNSWYGAYAIAWNSGIFSTYINYRLTYMGTDVTASRNTTFLEAVEGDDFGFGKLKESNPSWNNRVAFGGSLDFTWGKDVFLIPDLLFLETSAIFPRYTQNLKTGIFISWGMQWEFE